MSKKALVTGCCGFIGSALVKALHSRGWDVEGVDDLSRGDLGAVFDVGIRTVPANFLDYFEKPPAGAVLIINGDFTHRNVLSRIKSGMYDAVFHLAANPSVPESVKFPVETHENNVFKTLGLFHACQDNVKKVIFASSAAVYGNPPADVLYIREDQPIAPSSPYGIQKAHAENYASYLANDNTIFTSLRIFNVFGPGQQSGVLSTWCRSIQNNAPIIVNGDGNQTRDFCYIENVIDAFLISESNTLNSYNVYNVGSGVSISLNDIIHHLKKHFAELEVTYSAKRSGDIVHSLADITKINKELNYNPRAQFLYGLNETLRWWGMYV